MATSQGYDCEFVDAVPEDLYCKKCKLVARRLAITGCCGESFCHACIADNQEQGKFCPECGEKDFSTFDQKKSQKRIHCLVVYCSMKERGCGWSGTLDQQGSHLDPDQDNCQYVDTKCPLDCPMTIPKNKVEQHVAQHCAKRPYVCQHCNFKATYEEVVEKHLVECKYIPLQCPNLCGVTFERDFMKDHMKMCCLQEVGCEFSGVGCEDRFRREGLEEHIRQNSQRHLTLTALLAVKTKEQLQQKLLDQEKKHEELEEKIKKEMEEQAKYHKEVVERLRQRIEEQEKRLEEQKEKFASKLQRLEQLLREVTDRSILNEDGLSRVSSVVYLKRKFEMKNFSLEKAKDQIWYSPSIYSHVGGYKFCIGVAANGRGPGLGKAVSVCLYGMPGEYDEQLEWPVKVTFTLSLLHPQGAVNAIYSPHAWISIKTDHIWETGWMNRSNGGFISHSDVTKFLRNDVLYFHLSKFEVL